MSSARTVRMAARTAPRRAESQTAPDLRLVPTPGKRAFTRAATLVATVLAGAGLFGVVGLHVLLTQGQAELDKLHSEAEAQAVLNGQLTVDVALLEAPARVVDAARRELGMVPLAAVVYLPTTDPASPLPAVPEAPLPSPATTVAPAPAETAKTGGAKTTGAKTAPSTTPTTTAAKSSAAGRP